MAALVVAALTADAARAQELAQFAPPSRAVETSVRSRDGDRESTWTGTFLVPVFVTEDPFGVRWPVGRNDLLLNSRASVYEGLWYELLVQPDATAGERIAELVAPTQAAADALSTASELGEFLTSIRVRGTGAAARQLPSALSVVAGILSAGAAADAADFRAIEIYAALLAFQRARQDVLARALSGSGIDPEMRIGFRSAVQRIDRERTRELGRLRSEARRRAAGQAVVASVAEAAVGGLVGPALTAAVGTGVIGAALVVALPAVTASALSRRYDRLRVEAELVLLSTIDQQVLAPLDRDGQLSVSDQLRAVEVRGYVARLSVTLAQRWGGDPARRQASPLDPNYRTSTGTTGRDLAAQARTWAEGAPHYDAARIETLRGREREELQLLVPGVPADNVVPRRLVPLTRGASDPSPGALFDDFNDGNFTANPAWRPYQPDDRPGWVEVATSDRGPAFHTVRTGVGGNGGGDGIEMDVDISVGENTALSFDGKAVNRTVVNGCGRDCAEHPVIAELRLRLPDNRVVWIRYALNYDNAVRGYESGDTKQRAFNVPRNTWVTRVQRIRDDWPTAQRIELVRLLSSGWDYEGYFDNVRIFDPSPATAPPLPPKPGNVYSEDQVSERPERISSPPAQYPDRLRQAGIEGRVLIEVVIDVTGRAEPGSFRILTRTHQLFEAPARDVVQNSLFSPGRIQGRAVRVRTQVPINFTIAR